MYTKIASSDNSLLDIKVYSWKKFKAQKNIYTSRMQEEKEFSSGSITSTASSTINSHHLIREYLESYCSSNHR